MEKVKDILKNDLVTKNIRKALSFRIGSFSMLDIDDIQNDNLSLIEKQLIEKFGDRLSD